MIAGNDPDLMARVRRLRNHGIDKPVADRHSGSYVHWSQVDLGYKANMNDIQAALLRPQLARLDRLLTQRQRIAHRYDAAFSQLATVQIHSVLPGTSSARHLYTIRVNPERRDEILALLQQAGIGVAVNYRPIHLMPYYRAHMGFHQGMFPVAEAIGAGTVTLPLYPKLTLAEQNRVIEVVTSVTAEPRKGKSGRARGKGAAA